MSQVQHDKYKTLIGDGKAKITVGRELSEKDYGNGGGVNVNVSLTCDQSEPAIQEAITLAYEVANNYTWHYQQLLKQQLIQAGILKH